MSKNDKYYLAFTNLLKVSNIFKSSLFEFFDYDIEHAWKCKKEELKNFNDLYPNVAVSRNFFKDREEFEPENIEKQNKSQFITYEDKIYPKLLKEISDFPLLLYYKGNLEDINFDNTLAIVGSRKASESAKEILSGIISQMKNLPLTIVSGLAMGIDASAHKSAIKNGIKTIAVIASGFNFEYPYINKNLYKEIPKGNGVILTEYPDATRPMPFNFPQRNRIITGLSKGTLVVEATLKSGALISAKLTLAQNRELMCMPGAISNPNTEGIYKLIKEGAYPITCAEDIFDILNWDFTPVLDKLELSHEEKNIFDIISLEPVTFEKIQIEASIKDVSKLMITLTNLELKGVIKQVNGKYMKTGK